MSRKAKVIRKARVYIEAGVNEEILLDFLRHIQAFNAKHRDDLHINLSVDTPWMTTAESIQLLRNVDLPYEKIVPRGSMTEEQKKMLEEFWRRP